MAFWLLPLGMAVGAFGTYLLSSQDRERPVKETTTTKTTEPPKWSAQYLQSAVNRAADLYNRGVGGDVYTGPRVAQLSDQTRGSIDRLGQISGDARNPYINALLSNPLGSSRNLAQLASGELIGKNQYFNTALQNALGMAATNINQSLSGAGRYGSGAHTGVLANTLGNISTQRMAEQYNQDVANQIAANQLIDRLALQQAQAYNQYLDTQGTAALRALQGSQYLDRYNQALVNAQRELWEEQNERDWRNLARYGQMIKGLSGEYGESTGYTKEIGAKPRLAEDLGLLLGGTGSVMKGVGSMMK